MITNQNIIELNESLQRVGNLSGIKFAYVVARNKNKIKSEIDSFQEAIKQSNDFQEYEKKRAELCELHAKKDEKGKSIINGNEYEIDNQQAFEAQLKVLRDGNKEVIEAREKQINDFNSFLKEESKLELYKVDLKDVPENITTEQMSSIISIIKEEE